MSVTETLERLEQLNKKAVAHNRREDEINGFKKARIQSILADVEKLNSLGYDLKMELKGETEFTPESIAAYKEVAGKILAEKEAEAIRLERFFTAVETKDYETIKELTGEDVSAVSYDIEIESSKAIKADAKELTDKMIENDALVEASGNKKVVEENPAVSTVSENSTELDLGFDTVEVKAEENPTVVDLSVDNTVEEDVASEDEEKTEDDSSKEDAGSSWADSWSDFFGEE
jgi:hypothetical protein